MQNMIILLVLFSTNLLANFNFTECQGAGTFEQQIESYDGDYEKVVEVGDIPKGIKGLHVELISDKDVDIRLYGENEDKIVHWPKGILNDQGKETKPYKGVNVTYSGYNGKNGHKGHEFIDIATTTPTAMTMKAFGYRAGYATVNYSWTGKEGCSPKKSGKGNFTQEIIKKAISLVGTIPPNIEDVEITLTSPKDIDIQLYGVDGTAIVSWKPKGLLSGSKKQSIVYHDMKIEWSGYNGVNGQKGDEYIKITGKTTEMLVMKLYGYQAGKAKVMYKWGDSNTSGHAHIPKKIDAKIAVDFLSKASFGATNESIKYLQQKGIIAWIDEQLTLPSKTYTHLRQTIALAKQAEPTLHPASIEAYLHENDTVFNRKEASSHVRYYQMAAWFQTALLDKNQLRHRVAYALSQIIVESTAEAFFLRRAEGLATYMDILTKHAFGNYRDLLIAISHSASMGLYLTYNGSKKEQTSGTTTIYPDENYAREIMQLFTIGLSQLHSDGTFKLDAKGNTIPTYTQTDVNNLAKVFTGWDLQKSSKFGKVRIKRSDVTHPLKFTQKYHDSGEKIVLGDTIQSGNSGSADIAAAIDILMSHPNIGPFVAKQLIMRLVKSNPTPAYVARVANVFNDNGEGVKGDLKAVTRAIFLDVEFWEKNTIKKFKEPLLAYTQFLRAFHVKPLPVWRISAEGADVHNSIYIRDTTSFLAQAPTRAFSVFNFYNNRYIPNDARFKEEGLVAPEIQIQTDSMLIAFHNKMRQILFLYEKNYLLERYGTYSDIKTLIDKKYRVVYSLYRDKFLLDCSDEYAVMEAQLESTVDGHFESFHGVSRAKDKTKNAQGITDRDRALQALISQLDVKLTGGLLPASQKDILFQGYKEVFYASAIKNVTNPKRKIYEKIIVPIIVTILTSETYMVH